jgi:hypothetical protein
MKHLSIICAVMVLGLVLIGSGVYGCEGTEEVGKYIKDEYDGIVKTSGTSDLCGGDELEINYTTTVPGNGTINLQGQQIHLTCYLENSTITIYDGWGTTEKTQGAIFTIPQSVEGCRCEIQSNGMLRPITFKVKENPEKYSIEEAVLETSAPEEGETLEMEEETPKELINATREQLESNKTWNGVAGYIISLMLF